MTSEYNTIGAAISWPRNGAAWIEQELCIEPGDVPVQFTLTETADGDDEDLVELAVSLTEDAVVLKRKSAKVAHLPRAIPFSEFSDIVLWGALAANENGDVMVGLSLYSEQHDLQVPVCITADTDGLAARWTAWSYSLGLRPKVLNAGEGLRDPFHGLSRLMTGTAVPRRMPANRLARGAWADTGHLPGAGPRPDELHPNSC